MDPDERRRQILACAVRMFGERPYSEVSTTALAREAGVTRGLLHHYFGTKRGLYLEVVRRTVFLPDPTDAAICQGTLQERVGECVDWFLDAVSQHRKTFVAVAGAEGIGDDPEIEALLADADDLAARRLLEMLGVRQGGRAQSSERAVMRAYAGLVKAAVREWVRGGALTRSQVRALLVPALVVIVREVLPALVTGELN
ncbi:TetR/AcrR family transcriptional regulator [Leekyejoonella antrihumi]|uniref:TetR/AcrR family transcriptional regulator n=1 Tax=Leekyejoonella antrihumi TaxID=1660198 RepID=A0A563DTM8_9MICO|nr:TetR/AcrR family transcriptional regulator [Leekyejoonella antrihumi]TWP33620.1 TetR/AcrR family transcriptional regulator [Leekyejoonella antrihumi]